MSLEQIKPEDVHEKREVSIMYRISELGKYDLIKSIFRSYQFQENIIFECIRKCLDNYETKKTEFIETMKELLNHIDVNYKNQSDGKTILMLLCEKGEQNLIEIFLKQTKPIISLNDKDNSSKNIFHHLFTKKFKLESIVLKIFDILIQYRKYHPFSHENLSTLLKEVDNEGKIPLNLILLNGWSKVLSKYLEYVHVNGYVIPNENNNLIHCAIDGNSLSCLKIILSISNLADFTMKNKDGHTPSVYAAKKQKYFFSQIIDKIEANFNNEDYKNLLLGSRIPKKQIFNLYINKEYLHSFSLINVFKINQYIIRDILNIPLEWNIFLTKRYMLCQNGIAPEHILSKYLIKDGNYFRNEIINTAWNKLNNESSNSGSLLTETKYINVVEDIKNFFQKYSGSLNIKDHIDEESFPIDLIIYNQVILYFKLGDYVNLFETIKLYLQHIKPQNENKIYKFIVYINFTFILIEVFIEKNLYELASLLIDKTETDLNENYKLIKNMIKNENECEDLVKYLNDNEIFSQFSPTWDEYFCYLQLLKSLLFNKYSKKYLSEYKNVAKNCNYANNLEIFNKLKSVYIMIKAKMNYNNNFLLKSLKRISLIKEVYFDYSNEHKLFYYNSLGILNLKSRNYSRAELMFKIGLEITKKMNTCLMKNKKDALVPKSNFICYLQFNLALSFFFQRKYKESNELLQELSKINIMNKNIFLWYRLGLTSLELHFINKNQTKSPDIIYKTTGYSNSKNGKINFIEEILHSPEHFNEPSKVEENEDTEPISKNTIIQNNTNINTINIPNNNFDELYNQFELECKITDNDENYNNYYSQNKKTKPNKENKQKIIYLHSSSEKCTNSEFLHKAIYCFKKVLLLYNMKSDVSHNEMSNIEGIMNLVLKNNKKSLSNLIEQKSNTKGNIINLIISSYLNLLFTLSLTNKYTEMLYIIQNCIHSSIPMTSDLKIKLSMFKIEALLTLGRLKEVSEIINENIKDFESENFRIDLYNKISGGVVNEFYFIISLYISNIFLNCKKKNYSEAENLLRKVIEKFDQGKEIPNFIFNIAIFIFCSQGQSGINKTIKLIKKRNFDFFLNNQNNIGC